MELPCIKSKTIYTPRNPKTSLIHQIVSLHWHEYRSYVEQKTGKLLPKYIVAEFEEYLKCGNLEYGFLRLVCDNTTCDHEHLVPFSCKGRGFCPSCGGRHMAEVASHLIDNVLPNAAYRQFVISFPHALRYWAGLNTQLAHKVHKIIKSVIMDQYKTSFGKIENVHTGGITFEQRFGSGIQFNYHLHILMLDGVYVRNARGDLIFQNGKLHTKDIGEITANIARRVIKLLRRRGYIKKDGTLTENPLLDPELEDNPELAKITAASTQGKILFGDHAGKFVKKIGRGLGFEEETPMAKGESYRLCKVFLALL